MTQPLPPEALSLLSVLLQYPDDSLKAALPNLRKTAARLAPNDLQIAIDAFLDHLSYHPLLALQTAYTGVFDLDPNTTLNLTWHCHTDNEKRSAALARLQRQYDTAGWERATGDLPDYLPLMLEFLSLCPEMQFESEIRECLACLETVAASLVRTAPVYAGLLQQMARAIT